MWVFAFSLVGSTLEPEEQIEFVEEKHLIQRPMPASSQVIPGQITFQSPSNPDSNIVPQRSDLPRPFGLHGLTMSVDLC